MGEIADKFGIAFRDNTTQGVPASGAHEPIKREIRAIAIPIEAAIAAAALAGGDLTAAQALIAPLAASASAAQLAAEKAAETALELSDSVPGQITEAVNEVLATAADQPAFAALISEGIANRERIVARALLYGIAKPTDAKLFAADAIELAFADDYYRTGFTARTLSNLSGWETSGSPPIDGRGLFISGGAAAGILRPTNGDMTVIVEADMPAHDGTTKVLASYVGSSLADNVNIIRSDTGIYAMQLVRQGQGTLQVVGPTDLSARRMRVAFTIGAQETRVSFAGGVVLRIASLPPVQLLRLWLGRLALGNGNPLEGYITRAAVFPHTVSNSLLQAMAGGPVTDDEVNQLIDQKIRTHDNNLDAHELEALRRQADLADSKTGLWTVKAADTFSGTDGSALGNAETGGMPWTSPAGLVRKAGRVQHPTAGFGGAWLQSNAKDGQVEADLYPGTKEASLYVRLNAATTQWILLQRNADGGITLNIQAGSTIRLAPLIVVPVVAGERFKVRFIGPRIWVFRTVAGVETLLFDVTEARLMNETIHGVRLDGGGSADNFRVLNREAL